MQYGHIEVRGEIGILTLDYPPVNALGSRTMSAISEGFRTFLADDSVKAIVLACAGRTFVAGADITEIDTLSAKDDAGSALDCVANSPKPVIAAIHGTALGGGFELSLMCHYRIAVPSAKVGLPEVKLGLLPGGGGTQRLPRIVGIEAALDFITTGDPVAAPRALELGMIDRLAGEGKLVDDAVAFANEVLAEGKPLRKVSDRDDKVLPYRGKPELFADYLAKHADTFRGFVAPVNIVKAVQGAADLPFDEGMALEAVLFRELVSNRQSAAQRYFFFAERQTAKVPGIGADLAPRPISKVALVGDGLTGGLGDALTRAGLTVVGGAAGVASADLVIATDAAALAEAAASSREGAILLLAGEGAGFGTLPAQTGRDDSIAGLRTFAGQRVAEVVRTAATSPDVIATLMKLAKTLRLVPVLVSGDGGAIVERVLGARDEAAEAARGKGASQAEIDRALYDFGFAVGPFGTTGGDAAPADAERLLAAILSPAVNEGARILGEGAALRASDIDVACILAGGWPLFTGGPMFWADTVGLDTVVAALREAGHEPAPLLLARVQEGKGLSG